MSERHKCFVEVDAKLADRNTRVMMPIMLGSDQTERPMIVTEQIESGRGKLKACGLFATFCPFCGEALSAARTAMGGTDNTAALTERDQ